MMSDLLAAILGHLSAKYSQKKISRFALSFAAAVFFFCGYFVLDIFNAVKNGNDIGFEFFTMLIRDLVLFSAALFLICYVFLWCAEKVEKQIKK
ncbi:hypothetical protein CRG49_002850 [Neisseria sp. N95_16]|nr:hypothetical protein CRG49_002850 [Neisseria sp. N95_16]PJO79171.1 hypothetical protein CWC45_00585 [Neisseria sp. N177_16]QGL24633.1 hypothetical protein GJV52_03225 [Neisseria brasiliensis]